MASDESVPSEPQPTEALEKRICYKFRNSLLLGEAVTHPSLAYESQRPHFDNQRLEFLGDAVLQLVLTRHLYEVFTHFDEGTLTKLRSRLVSRDAISAYAADIGLGNYLLMGKGEEASGGRERPSTLADAFEALVGAIYLDSNLDTATRFILEACDCDIQKILEEPNEINPKGQLQELLQAHSSSSPQYRIISQEGPDHQKIFESEVHWRGKRLGCGSGNSKKAAEIEAARDGLGSPLVTRLLAHGAGEPAHIGSGEGAEGEAS